MQTWISKDHHDASSIHDIVGIRQRILNLIYICRKTSLSFDIIKKEERIVKLHYK